MAEARCPADGDENAELCESRAARLIDASVLIRHMLRRLLFLLSRRCRAVFNFKASEFGVAGVALHTPLFGVLLGRPTTGDVLFLQQTRHRSNNTQRCSYEEP